MDSSIQGLLGELRFSHNNFVQVTNQLDPYKRTQSGVCGEWSPKEVVAHLIGWDKSLKQFIVDIENFDPPYDVHSFNRQSVASRAHLSWDDVTNELETNFADLEQAVATIEPEMKVYDRVVSWLSGRIEDYKLHKGQMEAWL